MCDVGLDGDASTLWLEKQHTARKDYRCDGCDGAIRRREKYVETRSLFDGYWDRERMCLPCLAARTAFVEAHRGLIPMPSAFRETVEECTRWDDENESRWAPILAAMDERAEAGKAVGR